ncbi:MAG TPA: ATP-binding protein [Usitatibacter sp.]|nr:ATP-binding protein [Usitatibacter sp.]
MQPFPSPLVQRLAARFAGNARWIVLAMLLALHASLFSEPGSVFQRIWLLIHFGLFLMWQPFYAAEKELEPLAVVLLIAITFATLYFLAGWMIVMWLLLLLGILGGRVFTVHAARRNRFYLIAFTYVLVLLLLWAVPMLVLGGTDMPPALERFAKALLPAILAALALWPLGPALPAAAQVFDFFYAVLVFQLGVVLVLGSVALTRFTQGSYIASVALTVLGFGMALFVFAVLWNPMRGFGGLRTYFSRYLLSVGMPFELWMRRIAELAETETDSSRFLEQALQEISELPWVRGGEWRSPAGEGRFGDARGHASRFTVHGLEVVFYTQIELSPALFLHMRLLSQVVGEFYEGKRREAALRRNAYLQAVHETGARLTHDVKNLLQSLYALTSIAGRDAGGSFSALLQRQLPQLSRRLEATLDKLRAPEVETADLPVTASAWWSELERRVEGSGVSMRATIASDPPVPGALLDSFVDNALENARAKAQREPGIAITVAFDCDEAGTLVTVCDTGTAVPDRVARRLFHEPTERPTGLGIGLFHVSRLARQAGYLLELGSNRDGAVCFTLASGPADRSRVDE